MKTIHHDMHYAIDTVGFAQAGPDPDYEKKLDFEITQLMLYIRRQKPPRGIQFKIVSSNYGVIQLGITGPYSTFYPIKHIEAFADEKNVSPKSFYNWINKIEKKDDDEIYEIISKQYEILNELFANNGELIDFKEYELSLDEAAFIRGYNHPDQLMIVCIRDGTAPTTCPFGCSAEPDGHCEHGFDSVLLKAGII
jgi:hypothetical protein